MEALIAAADKIVADVDSVSSFFFLIVVLVVAVAYYARCSLSV